MTKIDGAMRAANCAVLPYVGNHGSFDAMARRQLSALQQTHAIRYAVVLAYLPKPDDPLADNPHTVYSVSFSIIPLRSDILQLSANQISVKLFVPNQDKNRLRG